MGEKPNLMDFLKERDAALRSLDLKQLIKFHKKWNPGVPIPKPHILEISLHKARTACMSLTKDERQFSKDWLDKRDYRSLADDLETRFVPVKKPETYSS